MKTVFLKTFGGLDNGYLFRQFFFGLLFGGVLLAILFMGASNDSASVPLTPLTIFIVLNILLYPYSRFVFDSITSFIMGDNVLRTSFSTAMILKYTSMAMCFALAIIIAPVGLVYLYFYHTRQAKLAEAEKN